jgi:hypothetical protein
MKASRSRSGGSLRTRSRRLKRALAWGTLLAAEAGTFSVPPNTVVRFGAGAKWTYATLSGAATCDGTAFGFDAAEGVAKTCVVGPYTAPGALNYTLAALFANNDQGAVLDFSDLTDEKLLWVKNYVGTDPLAVAFLSAFPYHSLFQDNLGLLPVYAVEQPIGLALDMRFGGLRGPELSTSATVAGQPAGGGTRTYALGAPVVAGRTYEITATVTDYAGTGNVGSAAGGGLAQVAVTGNGRLRSIQTVTTTAAQGVYLFTSTTNTANFTNISVREVLGNHAVQSAVGDRLMMDGRANRLTYSEQLANSIWVKSNGGVGVLPVVTDGYALAPDGTMTASRVQLSTGGGNTTADISRIYYPLASTVGAFYTESVWLKTNDGSTKVITFRDDNSLTKNVAITVTGTWQKFQPANQAANNTQVNAMGLWVRGGVGTDLAADLLVWHPHVERTNAATVHGNYQRVGAATDYDAIGFPKGGRHNGVNSWMQIPGLAMSASERAFVTVSARRDSDATAALLVELGTDSSTVNGTLGLFAPGTAATAGAVLRARGNTNTGQVSASLAAAPMAMLLSGVVDLAAQTLALRSGGAQVASGSSPFGPSLLSDATLYLGKRAGTSVPFGGVIYRVVVRGSYADSFRLALAESWANEPVKGLT